MATIHISEADAALDLHGVLSRVREGVEVVIEGLASPAVILRREDRPGTRLLSAMLVTARQHGSTARLDGEFEKDLEAVIASNQDPIIDPWS